MFPATENDGGSRSLGKQFLSCNKSSSTEILSSSELSENENNSSSSTPARPSSSSIRSQNTISPSPTPDRDAAVMAAFRNLFLLYASTAKSSLSRAQKPPRPPKRGSPYFKPKETWTHDFFLSRESSTGSSAPLKGARFQGNKAAKCTFHISYFHISVLISNLVTKHTVCRVTSFQGLPGFFESIE